MEDSIKEKIQSYLQGDLEEAESKELESLFSNSSELNDYISSSNTVWEMLDGLEDVEPDKNYISRFWNTVEETSTSEKRSFFDYFKLGNKKFVFASSFVTFLIVSAFLVNFFVLNQGGSEYVFNQADEELLDNLDHAITLNSPDNLQVFGPWDE